MTALQARAALASVQVSYGFPVAPAREMIVVGDATGRQVAGGLGQGTRQESFTLAVTIDVIREGTNQQACDEQAFTLADEVESEVRTNARLGITALIDSQIGEMRLEELVADDGARRGARLTIGIDVRTRI